MTEERFDLIRQRPVVDDLQQVIPALLRRFSKALGLLLRYPALVLFLATLLLDRFTLHALFVELRELWRRCFYLSNYRLEQSTQIAALVLKPLFLPLRDVVGRVGANAQPTRGV